MNERGSVRCPSKADSLLASAYRDDELSPEERRAFDDRLKAEPALRDEMEWLKLGRDACARWAASEVFEKCRYEKADGGSLWSKIEGELRKEKERRERSF